MKFYCIEALWNDVVDNFPHRCVMDYFHDKCVAVNEFFVKHSKDVSTCDTTTPILWDMGKDENMIFASYETVAIDGAIRKYQIRTLQTTD